MTIVTYNVKVGPSIEPFEIKEKNNTDQAFGLLLDHNKYLISKDFNNLPNIQIISSTQHIDGTGATVIANSEDILASDIIFNNSHYWYKVKRLNTTSEEIFVDGKLHTAYDTDFIYCHLNARVFQYKSEGVLDEQHEQIPVEIFPLSTIANAQYISLDGKYRNVSKSNNDIKVTYHRPSSTEAVSFIYEIAECANFELKDDFIEIKKCSFVIDDVRYTFINTHLYKIDVSQFLGKGFSLKIYFLNNKMEYIARTADRIYSSNINLAYSPVLSINAFQTSYSVTSGTLSKLNQLHNNTIDELERLLMLIAEANGALFLGTFTKSLNGNDINLVTYLKQASLKDECYEYATQDMYGSTIVVYGDITRGHKTVTFPDGADIIYMSENILIQNDIIANNQLQIDISLQSEVSALLIDQELNGDVLVNNNPYEIACSAANASLEDSFVVIIDGTELNLAAASVIMYNNDAIIENLSLSNTSNIQTYMKTSPQEAYNNVPL